MDFVGKLYLSYFKILTVVSAKNFDHHKKFVTVDEILYLPVTSESTATGTLTDFQRK